MFVAPSQRRFDAVPKMQSNPARGFERPCQSLTSPQSSSPSPGNTPLSLAERGQAGDTIHPSGRALSLEMRPGRVDRRDSLGFLGRKPVPLHTGQVFLFFFFFTTNPLCRHFQQQGPLSTPSPSSSPSACFDHPGASSKVLALAINRAACGVHVRKCVDVAHLLTLEN